METIASWPVDLIPTEVTVEIVLFGKLSLTEFIDFTKLCRAFRELRGERVTWLDILTDHQERELPLTCPLGTDLSQLSFEQLRSIGLQSYRLFYSWHVGEPSLLENQTRALIYDPLFELGDFLPDNIYSDELVPSSIISRFNDLSIDLSSPLPANILWVLPNSSLIVLYKPNDASLSYEIMLCNMGTGSVVARHSLRGEILRHSTYDEPPQHLIAIAAHLDNHRFRFCVLSVTLGDGTEGVPASLKLILDENRQRYTIPEALFIHRDIVGTVFGQPTGIYVDAMNLQDRQRSHWILNQRDRSLAKRTVLECFVVKNEVFLVVGKVGECHVYHLPSKMLPRTLAGQAHHGTIQRGDLSKIASAKVHHEEGFYVTEGFHYNFCSHGLHLSYTEISGSRNCSIRANAWQFSPDNQSFMKQKDGEEELRMLAKANTKVGSHWVRFDAPWLVASSQSGLCKVMIVYPNKLFDPKIPSTYPSLTLLRFGDPACGLNMSTCQLRTPAELRLDEVYSIAMDERKGIVYLSLVTGRLVALSYV